MHVAEVAGAHEQLHAAGAVDDVGEHELPHVPTCEDTPREAMYGLPFAARLELIGEGPNRGDFLPVREPFRQGHDARA